MASRLRKKIRHGARSRDTGKLDAEQHLEEQFIAEGPSPSLESLLSEPQLSSKFFTSLSAELRIAILTAAFGDRTVHIFYHEKKADQPKGPLKSIRRRKKTAKQDSGAVEVSTAVCRRSRYAQYLLPHFAIFNDRCHSLLETDDSWPQDYLAEIRVGVLGWLLSCRQAYTEGIDILYSTNTFHTASPALTAQLPNFIPLRFLARVRRIAFAWDWGRLTQEEGGPFGRQLASMLEKLPKELPRLSSLKIAFQNSLWPMSCLDEPSLGSFELWLEQRVLTPVDRVVESLNCLEECEVYFVASTHWYLAREMGMGVEGETRFWRDVRVGDGGGKEQKKGYWIREGRDDNPTVPCWVADS